MHGRDGCSDSKLLHLQMYAVKCINIGSTKDLFLTQVSDFAVLFGNMLDAEVLYIFKFFSCEGSVEFGSKFTCFF